jgi:hypothetical protein
VTCIDTNRYRVPLLPCSFYQALQACAPGGRAQGSAHRKFKLLSVEELRLAVKEHDMAA